MSLKQESYTNDAPYLRVSGEPKEMGRIHGETFAPLIRKLYYDRLDILIGSKVGISSQNIQDRAMRLWESVCKFDCQIATEVDSIAYASGLSPWQMIVAGGYTDLMDILSPLPSGNYHECTIAIDPIAGFIAGTWDSHPSAMDSLIILERHPKTGPSTLALTTAGWPCQQGLNSSGVGFAITKLTPKVTDKTGLIYIAANAALGSAKSVDEISRRLECENFCSGHSYIVVDKNGGGAILETTPNHVNIIPVNNLSTKANHYSGGRKAIDDNSNYNFLESSIKREDELRLNITGITDPHEFANCLLKSKSVNRKDSTGPSITCAHFFISVLERSIWYSKGPALYGLMHKPLSFRQLSNEVII